MNSLLQLFIRNGGFITFFVLQAVAFYLVVGNNTRQGEIFDHSYGLVSGRLLSWRSEMRSFLNLRKELEAMQAENALLRTQNLNARLVEVPYRDTFVTILVDTVITRDTLLKRLVRPAFEYVPANVLNNSISLDNNWIMINRGSMDGIRANMGVVSKDGVVGIVRHVDDRFAVVMSILHRQARVSASIRQTGAFGALVWEDRNPRYMTLKDIPRHLAVADGDTVVTSGYSNMFPEGHLVGFVEGQPKPDRENQYYFSIRVRLSEDPALFKRVYVVRHLFHNKLDSLQRITHE